jgi:hypothetical protein
LPSFRSALALFKLAEHLMGERVRPPQCSRQLGERRRDSGMRSEDAQQQNDALMFRGWGSIT